MWAICALGYGIDSAWFVWRRANEPRCTFYKGYHTLDDCLICWTVRYMTFKSSSGMKHVLYSGTPKQPGTSRTPIEPRNTETLPEFDDIVLFHITDHVVIVLRNFQIVA